MPAAKPVPDAPNADGALAEAAVDAINELHGSHPGYRAVHAKGILCSGRFTASGDAADLTTAPHLQAGSSVDVLVRFSNGSGDPEDPDAARDARGMAVKFHLPGGGTTDIVCVTLPRFFARTPRDFIAFTRARAYRPRVAILRPWPLVVHLARHPEALAPVRAAAGLKPVLSYARCRYNGLHSFRWIGADGAGRYVRYSWLPEAGEATESPAEARTRGPDYLREELRSRLEREPARFTLALALAQEGDPIDDATAAWPRSRPTVRAGTLEVDAVATDPEATGGLLVFDPTRVCPGIELSRDPILLFRRAAYSVSVERRTGLGQRAPAGED